ncbi:MAG: YHS domain protein [Rhodospirillaceae bacterium]|nr:YHS domain protein [Rhodospirillaceae bacterium]
MTLGIALRHALLLPAAVGLLLLAAMVRADAGTVYTERGLAIGGADPIAYFEGRGPIVGRPDITVTWRGAIWQFVSEAHRATFLAEPDRWAPSYGGYCAFSMSRGRASASSTGWWVVADEHLYLFQSEAARERFLRDQDLSVHLADEAWPMVRAALAEADGS